MERGTKQSTHRPTHPTRQDPPRAPGKGPKEPRTPDKGKQREPASRQTPSREDDDTQYRPDQRHEPIDPDQEPFDAGEE
jgi:hypothetical protein